MGKDFHFGVLGENEESFYAGLKKKKDILLDPITSFLAKNRIKPVWVTALSFGMVLPFIYFFKFNPWISIIFLVLNVILDGLDGSLARRQGSATGSGAVIDTTSDNLSFIVIFFTLFYYGLFNTFWGALYICNYIGMLFLAIISRGMKIQVFPIIRSRLYFYMVLFFFLFTGQNYYDQFLVLFTAYMMVTNVFLFQRIKCSL